MVGLLQWMTLDISEELRISNQDCLSGKLASTEWHLSDHLIEQPVAGQLPPKD